MGNPIIRLKALLNMKSSLCTALAADLEDACEKIHDRDLKIEAMKTELSCYQRANRALIDRQVEDHNMIKCLEDDVFLLTQRSEYRGEKMSQMAQEIELLKTEKRQLKDQINELKEWWREMDEDEDYQASIEVLAAPDIPFEKGEDEEEEEEKEFVWPNSSMQVEPD